MADPHTSIDAQDAVNATLKPLALAAAGRTGADIERLIREARQKARRQGRDLSYADIEAALTAGQATMSAELIWRIAVHESGHALTWTVLGVGTVLTVTVGNGDGGFVESELRKDVIQSEAWINRMLAVTLAGRAAERLIFGDTVMGSGGSDMSDLARATKLATETETTFGFGKSHPLLYRSAQDQPSLLSLDRQLAQHVHARLEYAETLAAKLLSQNRVALLALATRLAEAKVLDGSEVRALLGREMDAAATAPENPPP